MTAPAPATTSAAPAAASAAPAPAAPSRPRRSAPARFFRAATRVLLCALPAVLFFSYYPVISLGANASMNFELSLPLIWLVLFDLCAFAALVSLTLERRRSAKTAWGPDLPGISDRRIFLFTLFPFYATISAFWSANPLRGLLTAGILWLIYFAVFAIIFILPMLDKSLNVCYNGDNPSSRGVWGLPKTAQTASLLLSVFFGATLLVCVFCFVQSLLDLLGLSRETTLLCAGCTSYSFGFPHPSGFAIEPQFMGNLLLAPTLTALFLLIFRRATLNQFSRRLLTALAAFFSLTLFFTFSRGAIYAYLVALVIFFIIILHRRLARGALITLIVLPLATFVASLGLQGTFAALGPTNTSFTSAVTGSIHQLSLGLIDLRSVAEPSANISESNTDVPEPNAITTGPDTETSGPDAETPLDADTTPAFDGYVAESTNTRLALSRVALCTWASTPGNIFFGVGLGGAGVAMHAFDPAIVTTPKEIVQNQPISLLLELGLVGVVLLVFSLLLTFVPHVFSRRFLDGSGYIATHPATAASPTTTSASPATTSATPATSAAAPVTPVASATPPARPIAAHPASPLLLALLVAYFVTLQFFAGLPNALHIYLLPPLLYLIFRANDQGRIGDQKLATAQKPTLAQKSTAQKPNAQEPAQAQPQDQARILKSAAKTLAPVKASQTTARLIFNQIVLFFTIGCIFGTYWEEILCIVKSLFSTGTLEWVSRRGLLYGPFSPVYGIAAVCIYLVFYRPRRSLPACFVGGALFGGAIEALLSLLQEWIFGTRSWNYTGQPLSIFNGRTTIFYMIVWGALIAVFSCFVFPFIDRLYHNISTRTINFACAILAVILLLDIGISVAASLRQTMRRAGDPADTRLEIFLDTVYDDERMSQTYSNTVYVHADP